MKRNAAENLLGEELPGGWHVTEQVRRRHDDTGGNFSICYRVVNDDGRKGFCKVINYGWVLDVHSDPVSAMVEASQAFAFERQLTLACSNLSRIVTVLDSGSTRFEGYQIANVDYLIFESGDADIRRVLNDGGMDTLASRFRALHGIAAAVRQLHAVGIAHQDVKPSNALVFNADAVVRRRTKLADLGRASQRDAQGLFDDLMIAGDRTYAPVEALYRHVPPDFGPRRLACDLYQLGGMLAYVICGVPINGLLALELHPAHHWTNWADPYEDVLPFVRDAFGRAVERVCADLPASLAPRVRSLLFALCDPEPERRGHPAERRTIGSPYRLDRVVTEFDLLAGRTAIASRRSA
jgi:serine/threonine protein kinase